MPRLCSLSRARALRSSLPASDCGSFSMSFCCFFFTGDFTKSVSKSVCAGCLVSILCFFPISFVRGTQRGRSVFFFLLVAPSSPPLPKRSSRGRSRIDSSRVRARGGATEPPLVPLVVPLARPLLLLPPLRRDRRGVGLEQRAREPGAHGVVAGGHDRVEPGVEVLAPALGLAGREAPGRRGGGGGGGGGGRGGRGRGRWRSVGQRRTRRSSSSRRRRLRESRPGRERRHRRRRRRRRRRGRDRARTRTRRRRRCRCAHRRSRGREYRETKLLPRGRLEKARHQRRAGVQSSGCSTTTFAP